MDPIKKNKKLHKHSFNCSSPLFEKGEPPEEIITNSSLNSIYKNNIIIQNNSSNDFKLQNLEESIKCQFLETNKEIANLKESYQELKTKHELQIEMFTGLLQRITGFEQSKCRIQQAAPHILQSSRAYSWEYIPIKFKAIPDLQLFKIERAIDLIIDEKVKFIEENIKNVLKETEYIVTNNCNTLRNENTKLRSEFLLELLSIEKKLLKKMEGIFYKEKSREHIIKKDYKQIEKHKCENNIYSVLLFDKNNIIFGGMGNELISYSLPNFTNKIIYNTAENSKSIVQDIIKLDDTTFACGTFKKKEECSSNLGFLSVNIKFFSEGKVLVLRLGQKEPLLAFPFTSGIKCLVKISKNLLCVGLKNQIIEVYSIDNDLFTFMYEIPTEKDYLLNNLLYLKEPDVLIKAVEATFIRIFTKDQLYPKQPDTEHIAPVSSLCRLHDDYHFASGSRRLGEFKVWKLGESSSVYTVSLKYGISRMSFYKNFRLILVTLDNGKVIIFDEEANKELKPVGVKNVKQCTFATDVKIICICEESNSFFVYG